MGHNPSYVWRNLLKNGFWYGGLDQDSQYVLSKTLGFWSHSLSSLSQFRQLDLQILSVGELRTETCKWNWHIINEIFWLSWRISEVFHSCSIWKLQDHLSLQLQWLYILWNRDAIWLWEMGWEVAMALREETQKYFRKLWRLNIQSKIKIFIWKAIHAILPSHLHLVLRDITTNNLCPHCTEFPEQCVVKLFSVAASVTLEGSFVHGCLELGLVVWKGDDLGNFQWYHEVFGLAWTIVTRGQIVDTFEVLLRAISLWSHVLACQPAAAPTISPQTQPSLWLAPPFGFIKINVDVKVVQGSQRVGIEVVARDEHGLVLETQVFNVKGAFSRHVVELLAAREGMLLVSKTSLDSCHSRVRCKQCD